MKQIAAQHVGVFAACTAQDLDLAVVREDLAGEHLHHRGLAGAVPTEEAVDAVLLEREGRRRRRAVNVP
jgi:hypothetical protein